jgi:outer membrane protein OmpA-like peptidoglycan-associated protein
VLARVAVAALVCLTPLASIANSASATAGVEPPGPTITLTGGLHLSPTPPSYTDNFTYGAAYTLPIASDSVANETFFYSIASTTSPPVTGINTAGCTIGTAGTGFHYSSAGQCTVVVTTSNSGDADDSSNPNILNGHESAASEGAPSLATLTLTIGQSTNPVTVTASSSTVNVGSSAVTVTAAYSGLVNGDTSLAGVVCSTTYVQGDGAGTYPTTCVSPTSPTSTASYQHINYVSGSVTVHGNSITQTAPTSGAATTTNSPGFTAQLAPTTFDTQSVSYVVNAPNAALSVTAGGAISTTGALAAGSYTVSGTDSNSLGDHGTWTFTLTVSSVIITQTAPSTGTVSTTASASYTNTLATDGAFAVSFSVASAQGLSVDAAGHLVTTGTLGAGLHTVSGTTSDAYGDTGTYSFALTVTAVAPPPPQPPPPPPTQSTQRPLVLTSTSGIVGSPMPLSSSGGSGTGAVTYVVTDPGTAGCALTGGGTAVSATSAGTCSVTVNKAGDANYLPSTSGPTAVTFTATLTITAANLTVVSGKPVKPSASVTGLGSGDNATITSITYTYAGIGGGTVYGPSTVAPISPGTYSITVSNATLSINPGKDQGNYSSTYLYVAGTLTITLAPVKIPSSPPTISKDRRIVISPFGEGSYTLTKKLKLQILKLAREVKSGPYRLVELAGFTDNVFSPTFNLVLNQNRARVVSFQLIAYFKTLKVKGVIIRIMTGTTINLISTNSTAKGRAANRKVVATLYVSTANHGGVTV